jgi:glycosyltransferase involved in cell wall biosynthesis
MTRRRIAFLTTEYASEEPRAGGLASYLRRVTQALREAGHEPEVFVLSAQGPGVLDHEGVRVERVARADRHPAVRAAWHALPALGLARLYPTLHLLAGALGLSAALETRHAQQPFDAVQSADYRASGLFVPRAPGRRHLVRCSSASELWARADGNRRLVRRLEARLEQRTIRRADVAYAPSRFVADHLARELRREVQVLRPPAFLEVKPAPQPPRALPERFLLHVGKPGGAKGVRLLTAALRETWAHEPSFTLVLAGRPREALFERAVREAGVEASRVLALGPLDKPDLYAAMLRAVAVVQPSLVDNLPNSVIESLLLGVPVVGCDGASLDELVESGVTGELAPLGDAHELAGALLRAWRGESPARKGFTWRSPLRDEMRPERAVAGLLALAGLD